MLATFLGYSVNLLGRSAFAIAGPAPPVAAEHEDEKRGQRKTYHRRFSFPKNVDDDEITAQYNNGILEVRLPVTTGGTTRGKEIEVQT